MTKNKLTLICVQPSIPYYAWQVEVMLHNFSDLGIHNEFDIHCLFAYNKNESDWETKVNTIKLVETKFNGVAKFFYYEDTRVYPISYISSIRPNVLKQHFRAFDNLTKESIFYHDCDMIFSKFPSFLHDLLENDTNWYVSDTKSYIGYDYIMQKGEDVLDLMCEIVNIDKQEVKNRQEQSGGCQYLMKGVGWEFFDKVEKDCERMYKEVTQLNNKKISEDKSHHPLQIWASDMWCVLWNAWMRGYKTNIIPELDFSWCTDNVEKWNENYIYHNAGCVSSISDTHFYKGDFISKYPYLYECETYLKDKCGYKYFEFIKYVGKNSCLL